MILAGLALSLSFCPSIHAAIGDNVVYSQAPERVNGFALDTPDGWYEYADNFSLSSNSSISAMEWYGAYQWEIPESTADNFTINIYTDSEGLPGTLLSTYNVGNSAVREVTGALLSSDSRTEFIYRYELPEALQLEANTQYWFSVDAIAGAHGPPMWETSNEGDDYSAESVVYRWRELWIPTDFAFTLIAVPLAPEEGFSELHTSVPMVAFRLIDSFHGTASKRMLRLRQSGHEAFALKDPLDGLMLASTGDVTDLGPIAGDDDYSRNIWAKVYGIDGDVDSDGTIAGYDYQVAGVAMGIDYKVCQRGYLGFMFGIGDADAETDLNDDFDVRSYQLGVYSTYENGPYYLDGIVTYAFSDYETSRSTATGTASGDYDGNEWGVALEAGRVVDTNGLIFEPFIGAQYIYVDQDSFHESGAGDNNMSIESRDDYSMQVKAGARFSKIYQNESSIFVPEFKIAYSKEFGDDQDTVTANFVNTPAPSSFVVEGLEHDDHMIEVGLGCQLYSGNNISFDAELSTEFNDEEESYIASIGFKKMW